MIENAYDEFIKYLDGKILNLSTNIEDAILAVKIFEKYVPRLYGEYVGYINYRNDASTIKEPMFYPKQSGDKDFKNLEYKKW